MLRKAPVLIVLALALQATSPLEVGRRLTETFFAGRTDELWEKMDERMRTEVKSWAELAAFFANASDLLGKETTLLDYPNRFAYDFARAEDARFSIESPGRRNEDYASRGQPILAPAPGTVAAAADGVADNLPGQMDAKAPAIGNYVVIDHGNGEFSLLGHLRRGSIVVRAGDRVTAGQILGACGNSGNSNGPHLHYNLQTGPRPRTGTGLPAQFLHYLADGKPIDRGEPTRGQRVRKK